MAQITLTVTDIDIAESTYRIDFHHQGEEIENGQATAAYFTGFYLYTILPTAEFMEGVRLYGTALIAALNEGGQRPMTIAPASIKVVLTDKNLETGRYLATMEGSGGDESGESLPTAAQIIGSYMRYLINDMAFRDAAWAFAEQIVSMQPGSDIANREYGPLNINDDDAAIIAA